MNTSPNQTPANSDSFTKDERDTVEMLRGLTPNDRKAALKLIAAAAKAPLADAVDSMDADAARVQRHIRRIDDEAIKKAQAMRPATLIAAWLVNVDVVENTMETLKDYERFGDLVGLIAEVLPTIPTLKILE